MNYFLHEIGSRCTIIMRAGTPTFRRRQALTSWQSQCKSYLCTFPLVTHFSLFHFRYELFPASHNLTRQWKAVLTKVDQRTFANSSRTQWSSLFSDFGLILITIKERVIPLLFNSEIFRHFMDENRHNCRFQANAFLYLTFTDGEGGREKRLRREYETKRLIFVAKHLLCVASFFCEFKVSLRFEKSGQLHLFLKNGSEKIKVIGKPFYKLADVFLNKMVDCHLAKACLQLFELYRCIVFCIYYQPGSRKDIM